MSGLPALGEERLFIVLRLGNALISNLAGFFHPFLFPPSPSYFPRVFIGIMRTCVIAVSSLKRKCYINRVLLCVHIKYIFSD